MKATIEIAAAHDGRGVKGTLEAQGPMAKQLIQLLLIDARAYAEKVTVTFVATAADWAMVGVEDESTDFDDFIETVTADIAGGIVNTGVDAFVRRPDNGREATITIRSDVLDERIVEYVDDHRDQFPTELAL